jgi:hypothetical protein
MANAAELAIKVVTDATGVQSALDKIRKGMTDTHSAAQRMSAAAAVGFGGLVAVGLDAAKAAAADQASQEKLAGTMQRTTGAHQEQIAAMEEWITKTSLATGVADDQLRPAMSKLLLATGNATESQKALQTAMDVSTSTGKDLGTVTAAIAKGYAGNTAALGKLGLGIDKATLKSGDMGKIMAQVNAKVAGSTTAAANTAEGKWKRMTVGITETKEALGTALLPAIQALLGPMAAMAGYLAQHEGLAKAVAIAGVILAGALGALAVATKVITIVTEAWAAIQKVLDAELLANPIGLVVLAVVALITVVVILWNRFAGFRNVVTAVFRAVLDAIRAVWSWVASNWPLLLTILLGPIGLAVALIIRNFGTVKAVASDVFGAIVAVIKVGVGWVQTLGRIIGAVFGGISSAVQSVLDVFTNLFDMVGKVIDKLKSVAGGLLSHLPGIGSIFGGSAGATGYSPLGRARGAGATTYTRGGVIINVNGALDPQSVGRQIQRILNSTDARTGRLRLANPVSVAP